MRIDWLIPARYAELSGDGTMSILGGGVDTLLVPASALPGRLGIFLAMRVVGPAFEWRDTDHSHSVVVTDADGGEQLLFEDQLAIAEAAAVADPSREIGMLLPSPCRWRASAPGRYTFTVFVHREVDRSVVITVVTSPT
jgi:hypothetical protein